MGILKATIMTNTGSEICTYSLEISKKINEQVILSSMIDRSMYIDYRIMLEHLSGGASMKRGRKTKEEGGKGGERKGGREKEEGRKLQKEKKERRKGGERKEASPHGRSKLGQLS